jgi:uncharacterized protein YkwD
MLKSQALQLKRIAGLFLILSGIFSKENFAQETTENDFYLLSSEDFLRLDRLNQPIPLKAIDYSLLQATIFHATNLERIAQGLPEFSFSKEVESAAVSHAKDMVKLNFYSHTSPVKSRKTPLNRLSAQGITPHFFGENIGKTFGIQYEEGKKVIKPKIAGEFRYSETPQGEPIPPHTYSSFAKKIVKLWMDSPGHRQNILNPNFTHLGCGTYADFEKKFFDAPYIMAVQNFAGMNP